MRFFEKCCYVILIVLCISLLVMTVKGYNENKNDEAELQQCFVDGYEVTAKGEEITVLPEDWHSWSYVIDHEAKTVKFLELRPRTNPYIAIW